ncbi:MAG: hypothetical protein H0W83_03770 [Planctomycetes bacterium]|nr:hypothetical protein [Planctomycetota bacterium]
MILINLLPPELRKSASGINPIVVTIAAGASVCLLLLCFLGWIRFVKIPGAQKINDQKQAELITVREQADQVEQIRAQITEHLARRDALLNQLGKKVYWAHTLDDFVNLLGGNWPGFAVRCLDLTTAPIGGERKGESTNSFKVRLQVVGDERTKSGDYIKAFFHKVTDSTFWKQNGFLGKAEDTYYTDKPVWNPTLGKVIIFFNLEFQRVKSINKPKAGG